MNAVVTAEHRATSEIDLGDLNLARMHSLDQETNELKLCKTSCLDLSFNYPTNSGTHPHSVYRRDRTYCL